MNEEQNRLKREMQKSKLVFFGMPGSGKSMQAKRFAEKYGMFHLSAGEILREIMKSNTPQGEAIRAQMLTGELLPDSIVNSVVLENIPATGFILDGFPRKTSQIEIIPNLNHVVYLKVPKEELVKRIKQRNDDRADDTETIIEKRIKEFKEKSVPLLDYYKNEGILREVDGMGSPDEIFQRIEERLIKELN